MKINITPTKRNAYPKKGILIRSAHPDEWIKELQQLGIVLDTVNAFAIPSKTANELYGCFVILDRIKSNIHVSNVTIFQSVNDVIYIPEFSKINPKLSLEESKKLLSSPHIFHPDFGWFSLETKINWSNLITLRTPLPLQITVPEDSVFIPSEILSFQLISKSDEDITKDLDLKLEKPKKEKLGALDKIKLNVLKTLFSATQGKNGNFKVERNGLLKWLDNIGGSKGSSKSKRSSKWENNLEKLLYKNQKETDKLLRLLRLNPNSALKFAIPIDLAGSSRDAGDSQLGIFSKNSEGDTRFSNFIFKILSYFVVFAIIYLVIKLFAGVVNANLYPFLWLLLKTAGIFVAVVILVVILERLFGNSGSGGSGTVDDERLNALREQYEKLAKDAIVEKDYKKAASIYIKLLKDYAAAADALEDGKLYQEAALIHLKYNKDKHKAAATYEKGRIYDKAITLYKELEDHEKVGDIYKSMRKKDDAYTYYKMVIDNYVENAQFVKASLIYKYKIENAPKAQTILLQGWRENKDAYNCLTNYFSNFPNTDILKKGIEFIYKKETTQENLTLFLKALKVEHQKHEGIQDFTQNIAYEIVANNLNDNPGITYELKAFNTDNHLIQNDATRFVKRTKYKK